MISLARLIIELQAHYNVHGDVPVVIRLDDNEVADIQSAGAGTGMDADQKEHRVIWLGIHTYGSTTEAIKHSSDSQ